MLKRFVLYGLPILADLVVGLVLFVGRHSLASRGFDEATVGSVVLCYGFGYVIASLLMAKIVKPARVRVQMLMALVVVVVICIVLANVQTVFVMQALYCVFPLAMSLYFNAFQIYMLGISNDDHRPLPITVGRYTFAWSVGFAVGPFVSSLLKNVSTWEQTYYIAAGVAVLIGVVLNSFKPVRGMQVVDKADTREVAETGLSLAPAAWLGTFVGWTAYNVIVIYWPIQAVQLDVSDTMRGLVEFAFAGAQAVAALALARVPGWHHKPRWMAGLGLLALAALVVFGRGASAPLFALAGVLFGAYAGGMFSYMAYHSMVDEAQVVRRVATNETIVGICFLISSPVAGLLHRAGAPYGEAYLGLAAVVAVGLVVQAVVGAVLVRQGRRAVAAV